MNKLINIRNKLNEQLNTTVILKWKKRKGGTINIQFDIPNDPKSTHERIMQICPSNSYCWFRYRHSEKELFIIRRGQLQITFNTICDCYKIFTKLDKLNTNLLLQYEPHAVEIKFTDFNELDKIINSMGIKM